MFCFRISEQVGTIQSPFALGIWAPSFGGFKWVNNDPDFKVMCLVFRWFVQPVVHVTIKMIWKTNQKSGFHLVLPFEYRTTVCLVFRWICILGIQYLDPSFNGLLFQSNIIQSRNKNGFSSTSVLEALIWLYYFWLDKC